MSGSPSFRTRICSVSLVGSEVVVLFYASWLDEPWVPVALGVDDPRRDRLLASAFQIEEWPGLELRADADELVDYLPNNVGVRLCSSRMKSTIDRSIGASDDVQWLPASVLHGSNRTSPYFVLHLPGTHDFLNDAESVVVGDFVVKPVFSSAKVGDRNVLSVPGSTVTLIVTDRVRHALLASECSGVDFEQAAVRASSR